MSQPVPTDAPQGDGGASMLMLGVDPQGQAYTLCEGGKDPHVGTARLQVRFGYRHDPTRPADNPLVISSLHVSGKDLAEATNGPPVREVTVLGVRFRLDGSATGKVVDRERFARPDAQSAFAVAEAAYTRAAGGQEAPVIGGRNQRASLLFDLDEWREGRDASAKADKRPAVTPGKRL